MTEKYSLCTRPPMFQTLQTSALLSKLNIGEIEVHLIEHLLTLCSCTKT